MLEWLILILIIIRITINIFIYLCNKKDQTNYTKPKEYKEMLSECFILGTHDSLSYNVDDIFSPFSKTQNLNILEQLYYNVRFFDLRFKIINKSLIAYHGITNMKIGYSEVFNEFIGFLENNKNQFIIIVLKDEEKINDERVMNFIYYDFIQRKKLEKYFVFNNEYFNLNPSIRSLENKILILNFTKFQNKFLKLNWKQNSIIEYGNLYINDVYLVEMDKKILLFDELVKKKKVDSLNIFYFSKIFNSIYRIKNEIKLHSDLIQKKILEAEDKHFILIFDFIDLFKFKLD